MTDHITDPAQPMRLCRCHLMDNSCEIHGAGADTRSSADIEDVRQRAEDAIRTFCKSLGDCVVRSSDAVERIYYSGINLKALSAAVALAIRDVPQTLSQWQPIETAPREPEAMFMVCAVGDARGPFVVRSDILWRAREAGTPSHLGLSYLTHWMPLPEMPR